jgi:hypothetical protein
MVRRTTPVRDSSMKDALVIADAEEEAVSHVCPFAHHVE